MAHVIILDSINQDLFVCGLCKSVFNSLDVFMNHKTLKCSSQEVENILPNAVSAEPMIVSYSSSEATVPMNQDNLLESNCETLTTEPTDVTCNICLKKFKNRKGLAAHTKAHFVKPYQCLICGRCFMQNSHLQRHIQSHKVWPGSLSATTAKCPEMELLSYTCPYCMTVLENYNKFRAHLKMHQGIKKFKCIQGDCAQFFDNGEHLLHHVSTAHMNPTYTCYICNETYNSLESISTHQSSHNDFGRGSTEPRQYKCQQCDAIFKKPEKLSLHMQTENHKKLCIHCKRTFASDKRLRLHLQTHRNIKPYQCNVCNKCFHMKKYLTTHMLKHGQREFKCSTCKYMFKRQDLLQRHMRVHQIDKLFSCPFKDALDCKRKFSRKDKLQLHLKSHPKHLGANETTADQSNTECGV